MARLTHNDINSAVLVFFSDHGIRFGKIRETLSGKLEERMPFMHLWVPNKMRDKNLKINENRLTTPFDIHATLKHIISGKQDLNLNYGKSLLEEIPEDRGCESIPILEHWCSCQSSEPIKDLNRVQPIAQFIVKSINQLLAKDFSEQCVELTLDRTVSAFEQHLSEKVLQFEQSLNDVIGRHVVYRKDKIEEKSKNFLVTIAVKPSNALFEATVNMNSETHHMAVVGEVSRINKYGNQSELQGSSGHESNNAYLVNTTKCQIIRWPLFDEQVMPLYINYTAYRLNCPTEMQNWISIDRFNMTGVIIHNLSPHTPVQCFANSIKRRTYDDTTVDYMAPVPIHVDSVHYFIDTSDVKITCNVGTDSKSNKNQINNLIKSSLSSLRLYPNHKNQPPSLIQELQWKDSVLVDKQSPPLDELPNILFIGIDSISRVNFERHFPLTTQQLIKHNFNTLYGYNKVADNTFPNLTPLLTGYYLEDIWDESMQNWEYKSKGFKTLLIEDAPDMGAFNMFKIGFSDQPTDYYLRPFSCAAEHDMKYFCYQDKPETQVYFDYIYDFIKAMHIRKQKYFAFTFMARITHDDLNNAGLVDPMTEQLLSQLFDENLLENTVLVFFSDHGIRFGRMRETLSGKLEERMPFMHLYIPKGLRNTNVSINENRLTTPFDIHATLRHIIKGKPDYNLKYGKSILEEIPEQRGCHDIPILEHWCSCQTSEPITDLASVQPMAQFIVKSVNQLLSHKYSEQCAQLTLDTTVSAFEQHLSDKLLRFQGMQDSRHDLIGRHVIYDPIKSKEELRNFLITISVAPSHALLEATVNLNVRSNDMKIIGEVSRINKYGDQSLCINSAKMRRYCFCRELFKEYNV
ncbi:unnamed protein product [Oppiella nova]|uniref:Uncharacterized protein n=1 Tax=Oppiella nova TaxID=334625 RepID=A0A7R9LEG7_9ACAR|nr:unnamed protein product [Oppiella nova]CAG2162860.1 unnamed protein product [Oppiella nova]